jgi:AAA domain
MHDTAHNDVDNTSGNETTLTDQQRHDLDIARQLAGVGVPYFVAEPRAGAVSGFRLPDGWQNSAPGADSLAAIDRWRPGMALCALGGYTVDFLDVDPRNGGDTTETMMRETGMWPRSYGVQRTPSGGRHYLITPLRVGKHQGKGTLAGLDLQGGRPDGTGRGLLFTAPTVRVSKVDGVARAYEWETVPDLDALAEWTATGDDSGAMLAEIVREGQRISDDPRPAAPAADDPWDTPPRLFSLERAKAFLGPKLEAFKNMSDADTGFNAALNDLACAYSHFIPTYVSREVAIRTLFEAARTNGSVDVQGAAGVHATIRSGLDQRSDPWKAELPPDPSQAPTEVTTDPDGAADPVTAMLAELLTADEMSKLPNPVPLVNGVLDMDTLAWLIGAPGSYKSFAALDIAGHVGTGRPWLGHAVRAGRVVYLVAEGTGGMTLRTRAWQSRNGPMTDVAFLPRPVQAKAAEWTTLVEACRRHGPVLIIIDTQARVTVGIDESSNTEMGLFIEQAERLRRATGACVLMIHHTGRDGANARGASAIDAAQGTELKITSDGPLRAKIAMDKQKDMSEGEPLEIQLERVEGGTDPDTGRDLSSLVVGSGQPFDAVRATQVRDWVDNLARNQAEILGIVRDHFLVMGGTKAEIKKVLQERRRMREVAAMADGSFARAWDSLTAPPRQLLLRVEPSQRYAIDSLVDVSAIRAPSEQDQPESLS